MSRANSLTRVQETFKAAVERASKNRRAVRQNTARTQHDKISAQMCSDLTQGAKCTIVIQPFYPSRALMTPQDLRAQLDKVRIHDPYKVPFPWHDPEPIPDGVLITGMKPESGEMICQQLHANGLIYECHDAVKPWNHLEALDKPSVASVILYENQIAARLWTILKSARLIYQSMEYQGGLVGYISLTGVKGMPIQHISPQNYIDLHGPQPILLPEYKWEFQLDTAKMNDDETLKQFFVDLVKEVSWGLGNQLNNEQAIREISSI